MNCILNFKKCSDDDLYHVLGCSESSTVEQILTEYKAISLKCHPDKNAGDPNAVEKFQKIQKAKEILTNPEKKALYDKWCKCGFSMPFEQFLNINKAAHTSIHWCTKKQKDLMLESPCVTNELSPCEMNCSNMPKVGEEGWERDSANAVLQRFRNYEI